MEILYCGSVAAVNSEISASHEAASTREQEDSRRFEVLWRSEAAEQCASHPCLFDFGLGCKEGVGHCGADVLEGVSV